MHADVAHHPEAGENRRLGSQVFRGVRADYFISQDTLALERAGQPQTVAVLLGRGGIAHWYAPFVHTEVPGELAKLRAANEQEILDFAATYGDLGFPSLSGSSGALLWHAVQIAAKGAGAREAVNRAFRARMFHHDPQTRRQSMGGDPLPWIRGHATGIYICLTFTEALNKRMRPNELEKLINSFNGSMYGRGDVVAQFGTAWRGETPVEMARHWRREIINSNLRGITRYVSLDDKGKDRSFFGYDAPVSVAYWHLANAIDGGIVKRCEANGCGGLFIQTDPRQRYCPKRWRQRESSCAMRQRQREARR